MSDRDRTNVDPAGTLLSLISAQFLVVRSEVRPTGPTACANSSLIVVISRVGPEVRRTELTAGLAYFRADEPNYTITGAARVSKRFPRAVGLVGAGAIGIVDSGWGGHYTPGLHTVVRSRLQTGLFLSVGS